MAIKISSNTIFGTSSSVFNSATVVGGVASGPEHKFQGTVSGYTSGGFAPPQSNVIDKFSFSSDGNATDVGDLTQARLYAAGQSSDASGYTSGGKSTAPPTTAPFFNTIDKFSFTSDGNATDVGDLTQGRYGAVGQSSREYGYSSGGNIPPLAGIPGGSLGNTIDKFPFATDGNATDVGDLTVNRYVAAGQSSREYGYTSGGFSPWIDTIDKFPFSADADASDVGNLSQARAQSAGQSSSESGYTSGGNNPAEVLTIDKFPFSVDSNATDVGDLTQARRNTAGQSSDASGYTSGGAIPTYILNTIDKFPFASDGNATDVGDLTQARYDVAGQQV